MSLTLQQDMSTHRRWRTAMAGAALVLLVLPAIAMQFTDAVRWDAPDFAAAALLLAGVAATAELAFRLLPPSAIRAGVIGLAVAAAMVVWADAAVGIF
ncbi:hypothetical protein [Sphingomonas xinjiangensis]|uniref:Uncharacterized protein n=1 Tax=Sphingomonas xinjiangensis TaxID=643568 RepID=A0A840YMS9_9SPHN|nr:hypothetical protein [Sphingomonas xinjiangensis]MBB5711266.1 hypothetical protein [Sphingomonas xinjiangensis]